MVLGKKIFDHKNLDTIATIKNIKNHKKKYLYVFLSRTWSHLLIKKIPQAWMHDEILLGII